VKPLNEVERRFVQSDVDTIYNTFLSRVAEGRNMSMANVDSIGQGRVWMGEKALQLGLVDKLGNLQDAINCAARMAKIDEYQLREYPEPQGLLEMFFDNNKEITKAKAIKEEVGEDGFKIYSSLKKLKQLVGISQARMPFDIDCK
jgi:protease-4